MTRATADFTPVDPVSFEQSIFSFNFTPKSGPPLLGSGETIASAVFECNVAGLSVVPDSLSFTRILGGYSVSGTVVSQMFGTFVAGCTYELVCTITTSLNQIFTLYANVYCQPLTS